jgi:hypothetical protein
MAEFLVELYVARGDSATVEGGAIRYVRTIFVPEDETCFFLYEAESADAVREATRLAGLSSVRITEALGARKEEKACL